MIDYSVFLLNLLGLAVVSWVERLRPRPSAGDWPKSWYKENSFWFLHFSHIVGIFADSTKSTYGRTSRRFLKLPRGQKISLSSQILYSIRSFVCCFMRRLNIFNFLDASRSSFVVFIISFSPHYRRKHFHSAGTVQKVVEKSKKSSWCGTIASYKQFDSSVLERLVFILMVFLFPAESVTAGRSQPVLWPRQCQAAEVMLATMAVYG